MQINKKEMHQISKKTPKVLKMQINQKQAKLRKNGGKGEKCIFMKCPALDMTIESLEEAIRI